jgi:hypothetical protein
VQAAHAESSLVAEVPAVRRSAWQVALVCSYSEHAVNSFAAYSLPLLHAAHAESSLVAEVPSVRRSTWHVELVCTLVPHCPVVAESE